MLMLIWIMVKEEIEIIKREEIREIAGVDGKHR